MSLKSMKMTKSLSENQTVGWPPPADKGFSDRHQGLVHTRASAKQHLPELLLSTESPRFFPGLLLTAYSFFENQTTYSKPCTEKRHRKVPTMSMYLKNSYLKISMLATAFCAGALFFSVGCSKPNAAPQVEYDQQNVNKIRDALFTEDELPADG